jgi:hypothetical protein
MRVVMATGCLLALAACHARPGPETIDGSDEPMGIDLSVWSLQLPTGLGTSPTTISPAMLVSGYTDAYFYVATDGGQAFMDPITGVTTSGSQLCRTELREDSADGQRAAWASTDTNALTVAGAVTLVGGGAADDVTIGQVFNDTDSATLGELQYSSSRGGFQLLYEEAKGTGKALDLQTPVTLGTRYTFTLALTDGVLTVDLDGHQVYTHTLSTAIAAKRFYFKLGDYDQTSTAGAVSITPYTIVEAYGARVVHP